MIFIEGNKGKEGVLEDFLTEGKKGNKVFSLRFLRYLL